jgi:YgiT-type zinc finger domain-containing protein
MTTETAVRRHRCGGALVAREVQVVLNEGDDISLSYRVHGFICDKCHEQLIDRETALQLQASQTPTIAWNARRVASTELKAMKFDPLTAGTPQKAVA